MCKPCEKSLHILDTDDVYDGLLQKLMLHSISPIVAVTSVVMTVAVTGVAAGGSSCL